MPDLPHPLPPFIDAATEATRRRHRPKNFPKRNNRPRNKPRTMDKHPRRSPRSLQDLETNPTFPSIRTKKKRSKPPPKSTTNTKAPAQQEATNPTPQSHKHYYNMKEGTNAYQPKQAQDNGVPHYRLQLACSV